MCGIVGYVGNRDSRPIIHKSLSRLTYRGYDSWGFGFRNSNGFEILKDVGDISEIENIETGDKSGIAMGHCRWATHGKVTKENAHPHSCCKGDVVVVHNGIIENHSELRKMLEQKGHVFSSQTDTEVIAHLISELCTRYDFREAVRKSVRMLKGSYAFVAMHRDFEGLIGVKNGSPLIIGIGDNEGFIASDAVAFIEHTRNAVYLEDGEMAVIS